MDRQLPKLQGLGVFRQRDENAPNLDLAQKTLHHHRNKSMSALSSTLLPLKGTNFAQQPSRRAVFADVSNIRSTAVHDDLNVKNNLVDIKAIKPLEKDVKAIKLTSQKLGVDSQNTNGVVRAPMRPLSLNKALPAEPINSQVFAQPSKYVMDDAVLPRKTIIKRHTTIFNDTSYGSIAPLDAAVESKPALAPIISKPVESVPVPTHQALQPVVLDVKQQIKQESEPSLLNTLPPLSSITNLPIAEQMEQKNVVPPSILPVPQLLSLPSDILKNAFEPLQENTEPELFLPALETQPESISESLRAVEQLLLPVSREVEEYWDEEEDEYFDAEGFVTARSIRSIGGENTTGGMSIVLLPRVTARVERELAAAKIWVMENVPEEDLDDECWDTTMVAEYSEEIFLYLRDLENRMMPNPYYMENQTEIQWSMRSVLIDWVTQVHLRFQLLPETLFLAVNCIDRFLTVKVVSLAKLQLVGATALYIAAKYEEINCPSVQEIAYMVDGSYTVEEILKAERFMLTMLKFEMGWPGPMSFLRKISKADDYDVETRTLAKYFLEVCMMDERFVGCTPSFLAAGAHCLSRLMLRKGNWSLGHVHYSQYTYSQIRSLLGVMLECCQKPREHHSAVFDKYSQKQYKKASLYVETELTKGFELPAVMKRESSLGVKSFHSIPSPPPMIELR